jgi:hypothetical protein
MHFGLALICLIWHCRLRLWRETKMTDLSNWRMREGRRRDLFRQLFEDIPSDPAECHIALQKLSDEFLHTLAEVYGPKLIQRAESLSITTISDKRDAATLINRWLRELRLTLGAFDDVSGETVPASLMVNRGGGAAESGRFQLMTRTIDDRKRIGWTGRLPELKVVVAPIREENFARKFWER